MRKVVFLSIICMLIASLGCLATPGATTGGAAIASKYDAMQDSRIVTIEGIVAGPNGVQSLLTALTTRVNGMSTGDTAGLLSRISSLETRLATAEGKLATATPADTSALSARIKTLEDWKAGLGTGSGPGTPSVPTGSISAQSILLSNDQDIELWLEWVDPNKNLSEYETRFANEVEFQFAIKNKSLDSTRKYTIEMRLTPEEDTVINLIPVYMSTSMGTWVLARPINSGQNPVTLNSPTGTAAGRISRNTVDKYNFRLQIAQTPSVYWKVRFYIEQLED